MFSSFNPLLWSSTDSVPTCSFSSESTKGLSLFCKLPTFLDLSPVDSLTTSFILSFFEDLLIAVLSSPSCSCFPCFFSLELPSSSFFYLDISFPYSYTFFSFTFVLASLLFSSFFSKICLSCYFWSIFCFYPSATSIFPFSSSSFLSYASFPAFYLIFYLNYSSVSSTFSSVLYSTFFLAWMLYFTDLIFAMIS